MGEPSSMLSYVKVSFHFFPYIGLLGGGTILNVILCKSGSLLNFFPHGVLLSESKSMSG